MGKAQDEVRSPILAVSGASGAKYGERKLLASLYEVREPGEPAYEIKSRYKVVES